MRLNGRNDVQWKYQISVIFCAHALFGHLDDSTHMPQNSSQTKLNLLPKRNLLPKPNPL